MFQTDWVESSTLSNLVIENSCSTNYHLFCHTSCTSVLSRLWRLTITYFILEVKSGSPTFSVTMSANCRPPLHKSILWIFHFSPFLTKCIILAICLMSLVSLPILAIHTAEFLTNIIRGASSGNLSGLLFRNSWINNLKCDIAIPAVHAALYSLSSLDWATGTEHMYHSQLSHIERI